MLLVDSVQISDDYPSFATVEMNTLGRELWVHLITILQRSTEPLQFSSVIILDV